MSEEIIEEVAETETQVPVEAEAAETPTEAPVEEVSSEINP